MSDSSWSNQALKRFDSLGLEAPLPESWLKFEKESMEKYFKAKEEARNLLDKGKRAEAVKLLNTAAETIWNEAAVLLELNKK